MPSQKKLVVYLICGSTLFLAMVFLFKGRLVPVIAMVIFGCLLIDGLITGEIAFGQLNAKRVYRRRESPIAYWSAVFFWSVLIGAIAVAAFLGDRHQSQPADRAGIPTTSAPAVPKR